MVVRVLVYAGLLWQQIIWEQKLKRGDRLPPVLSRRGCHGLFGLALSEAISLKRLVFRSALPVPTLGRCSEGLNSVSEIPVPAIVTICYILIIAFSDRYTCQIKAQGSWSGLSEGFGIARRFPFTPDPGREGKGGVFFDPGIPCVRGWVGQALGEKGSGGGGPAYAGKWQPSRRNCRGTQGGAGSGGC